MPLENEDIKQLIAILQRGLSQQEEDSDQEKAEPKQTSRKNSAIKNKNRTKEEEHSNKFLDMPEKDMHKSDSIIDRKLRKFPPTPRNRPASMVKVTCRVCGKTEVVSSVILPESASRYKCNMCSTSGG